MYPCDAHTEHPNELAIASRNRRFDRFNADNDSLWDDDIRIVCDSDNSNFTSHNHE